MPRSSSLPRIYVSFVPELDWLTGIEFGRVEDGQPKDCWVGLSANVGLLLNEPFGTPIGFKVKAFSGFEYEAANTSGVWDKPRFHAPQLGLAKASIGEIALAARTFFAGHESVNRFFFTRAMQSEGEEAVFFWRRCLEAGDCMAHFALGYTLYELERFHEAYRHLRYYVCIAPSDSWNWCWFGKSAEAIGEIAEARSAYEMACAIEAMGGEETDAQSLLAALPSKP